MHIPLPKDIARVICYQFNLLVMWRHVNCLDMGQRVGV